MTFLNTFRSYCLNYFITVNLFKSQCPYLKGRHAGTLVYRQGSRGAGTLSDLPVIMELAQGRTQIQTQAGEAS